VRLAAPSYASGVAKGARASKPPRPSPHLSRPRVALAAAAVLLLAILVVVVALPGGSGVAATMRAAGCSYRDVVPYPPLDEATRADYHADVPTLAVRPRWTTFPPSGGAHYRLWARWGFYRRPVNPAMVVHNEEHGGVVIWWGPAVGTATVDELERFYDEQPVGVFGTPIRGLGDRLALTAWTADPAYRGDPAFAYKHHAYGVGHLAICPRFDQHAFAVFRDAYRGRSPQGFPLAADRPGCGPTTTC
jgi:hypothetical protein